MKHDWNRGIRTIKWFLALNLFPRAFHQLFMRHFYHAEIPLEDIEAPAVGARRRWLVDVSVDSPNFTVAEVEVQPGGSTLYHTHPYEHAMFILEGTGEVVESTGTSPLMPWEVLYIASNELHQIRNTGGKMLKFLSVEPTQKEEKKP
jgi:quercetin dioxygenase-like cupin family protein